MAVNLSETTLSALPDTVGRPGYDRGALGRGIVHVGVGNFHRAHMAWYLDQLFEMGEGHDWGLIGAGVRPGDAAMRDRLAGQDWLTTVVELDPDGLNARVIGSMIDFVPIDPQAVVHAMADPAIRIVSLTITEGGYYVDAKTDGFDAAHPDIAHDAAHPDAPKTVFGMILAALRRRRDAGSEPFTVMSCDNLPENGHVCARTVTELAQLSDPALADWIRRHVAFPNSMVDCITPATSDRERSLVSDRFGIADAAPVVCEPFRQWVLEDHFPQGRPPLERVGAEFVADVSRHELMKLRILNGGHAAIAYPSALLGHHFVHDAMADPQIEAWLRALETREIIPTLQPIPGVSYDEYLELIVSRFANPEIGDTILRLCLDGSNRQPKFILPVLADTLKSDADVDGLAQEVAFWCRYCEGTDEAGNAIAPNDDNHAQLREYALASRRDPLAFLQNETVFGPLAGNPVFREAFARKLTLVQKQGVRTAIDTYLSGTRA
ncbi:mannitol dehydrogenase family protein [Paracoccus sediminis]|uniref:Mannitol 2-dehydrogenase n=1 Tax=Paracoccus sediminis TaxID=1214787 RepID=A0A238WG66_9RHOB|nr:mannitol dehydrogenase family protein [Paracoccus sediminis]TBN50873.1 mannitol dehydrogenase family protein [Paracoccus sediminis]SNR45283.1 mannitol 2-dehydrogenase [Paracoccus sediminis]